MTVHEHDTFCVCLPGSALWIILRLDTQLQMLEPVLVSVHLLKYNSLCQIFMYLRYKYMEDLGRTSFMFIEIPLISNANWNINFICPTTIVI